MKNGKEKINIIIEMIFELYILLIYIDYNYYVFLLFVLIKKNNH